MENGIIAAPEAMPPTMTVPGSTYYPAYGEVAAGTRVQRQRHSVDREVAAAQILVNGRGSDGRWFARLVIDFRARHVQLGADIARHQELESPQVFVHALDRNPGFLQILLQLERISLNAQVDVADGKSSHQIADGATGEI